MQFTTGTVCFYSFCRVLFFSVMLTGCSRPTIQSDFEDYTARLARVLETPLNVALATGAPPYPDRQQLLLSPPTLETNLTRLFELQQCELGAIVAERNTALGKVQHYSQQLRYENKLLHALADCITYLKTQPADEHQELLALITDWQWQKQLVYTMYWSNMLTLSSETKEAFTRELPGALKAEQIDIAGQKAFFNQLEKFASPTTQADQIETSLQAIGVTRIPASVWAAQRHLTTALSSLTGQLQPNLQDVACPDGKVSEQATILRNVFYLFFIERIQPVGGRINDFNYQFNPAFARWQSMPVLPEAFKDFIHQQQQSFIAYQQAMQAHVKLWQDFLSRCHLSPVAPTGL